MKAKFFSSLHIDHLSRKIELRGFDALGEAYWLSGVSENKRGSYFYFKDFSQVYDMGKEDEEDSGSSDDMPPSRPMPVVTEHNS